MSNFPFFSSGWIFAWHQGNVINQRVCVRDKWTNTCMWVSVSLWVLMSACLFLPTPLSHCHFLSHSLSLNLYVWISFPSCEERTFCIFSPCSDLRTELSYVLAWSIYFIVCIFFFHILSFSTMCFCSSQGTWLNLGQDQLIFAQYLTMWVSCTSFLDWKLHYSSMTFKMVLSTWKVHVCILPLYTQIVKKLSVEHWQKWKDKEHK